MRINTVGDPTCVNGGMYYRAYTSTEYPYAKNHQAKICTNGSWVALGVPRVTSLPPDPADGDEVYYAPNGTSGVVWHVRYDANITTDNYKWVVLGGGNLHQEVNLAAYTSSTAQTNTLTVSGGGTSTGPSLTLPRAGIWDITVGARARPEQTNTFAVMTYNIPGVGADGDDGIANYSGGTANIAATGELTKRKTITTNPASVTASYWQAGGSGNVYFSSRVLSAMPIRLAQ